MHANPGQRLDRQFRHADRRGIRYVAVVGPDEAAAGTAALKDLQTGEQTTLSCGEVIDRLRPDATVPTG